MTPATPTSDATDAIDDPSTDAGSPSPGRRRSSTRGSTRRLSKAEYELEKEEEREMKRRAKEVASPLRWALIHNNFDVVKMLVLLGAPIRLHQVLTRLCALTVL